MIRNIAILACLLIAALAAPAQVSLPKPEARIEQRLDAQVPLELTFRDESGREVALGSFFGEKPVILVLAYYRCPRLCSLVLNHLADDLREINYGIGEQFTVVTVSIDPREQPDLAAAKKQAYVDYYGRPGARTGWHFLTGETESIQRLADAVGFRFAFDEKTGQFAHASGIMLLTARGKISRYFLGLDYPPRDLAFALEDASAGKIGSPIATPLRLLCFGYDPDTGKYTFLTMRLVRLGGLATIGIIVGLVVRSARRERRQLSEA